jgi:hypothetical protein
MPDTTQTIQVQDQISGAVYQIQVDATAGTILSIKQVSAFTKNSTTKVLGLGLKVTSIGS